MTAADDFVAIFDRISTLYQAIDRRDFVEVGSCLTPDCTLDVDEFSEGVPPVEGREAIVAGIRQGISTFDVTQHLVGTPRIRVDGDQAHGTFYAVAQHVIRDYPGGETCMAGGTCEDDFVRTDDGWLISRHQVRATWELGNLEMIKAALSESEK